MYKLRAKITSRNHISMDIPIVGMLIRDTIVPNNTEHWIITKVIAENNGWTIYARSVERFHEELWCMGINWEENVKDGYFTFVGMVGFSIPIN